MTSLDPLIKEYALGASQPCEQVQILTLKTLFAQVFGGTLTLDPALMDLQKWDALYAFALLSPPYRTQKKALAEKIANLYGYSPTYETKLSLKATRWIKSRFGDHVRSRYLQSRFLGKPSTGRSNL